MAGTGHSPLLCRQRRAGLVAGPWLWQPGGLIETELGGTPPSLVPGQALLVSASPDGRAASLWSLRTDGDGVPFIEDAEHLWRDAVALLPATLGVFWRPLVQAQRA